MKRGFTILELLVASLLLGMLTMILTMMMNQSSISWRIGVAGVADLDDARQNIGILRDEADNVYPWNNESRRLLGLWDSETGQLRTRAWNVDGESKNSLSGMIPQLGDNAQIDSIGTIGVGKGDGGSGRKIKSYTVNVMSAGPNGIENDYDDIWSYPDDIAF